VLDVKFTFIHLNLTITFKYQIWQIIQALWEVHMQSKMAQVINKAAEGSVTTVEVSEGVVDSLCAQEWDGGLSMDHLQERSTVMGVEGLGWVRRVADDVTRSIFVFMSSD